MFKKRLARPGITLIGATALLTTVVSGWGSSTASAAPQVFLVGTYNGIAGQYTSIQAAVDAANPGDWILVGPGDYHESDDIAHPTTNPGQGQMGGVYVDKAGLTLRGMNRQSVIVDGTLPGSPACSSNPADQNYGATGSDGSPVGRNGILIWKADDVTVDNMTVCNFLAGSGASGNQIWWNGGAGSGQIGLSRYRGSYLTATSTFFSNESTAAEYGIFASNAAGPASWNQLYASEMNDSGTYVGACKRQCDVTLNHMWMEHNALGYSGTNSGGTIVIENSQFDNNQDGLDTNTQLVGDPPAPQDGRCPGGATSPITHTTSCWVLIHNYIHDNNDPNNPASGGAAAGPVGTGLTISGGRFDTVMDNNIANNGAWGALFVPYAQTGHGSLGQTCAGIGGHKLTGFGCVLDPEGDALNLNWFNNNGFFGNPSNSDYGMIDIFGGEPQNCFNNNYAPDGSAPADLAKLKVCGVTTSSNNIDSDLFPQVLCDSGFGSCPVGANYPQPTGVVLHPLPTLPTMPNPCKGVPTNPWCPPLASPSSTSAPALTALAVPSAVVPALPQRRTTPFRRSWMGSVASNTTERGRRLHE